MLSGREFFGRGFPVLAFKPVLPCRCQPRETSRDVAVASAPWREARHPCNEGTGCAATAARPQPSSKPEADPHCHGDESHDQRRVAATHPITIGGECKQQKFQRVFEHAAHHFSLLLERAREPVRLRSRKASSPLHHDTVNLFAICFATFP